MRHFLQHLGEKLRTGFLAVPALMIMLAIILSQVLRLLDTWIDTASLTGLDWMRVQDPHSARALLATIATSIITVAGTVFSITVVALTLASNQFGPRLVRNFIRDRGTQTSLGIFLSTFVYALMTMRNIDTLSEPAGNYDLAVHIAVLLALISIGFLIYFIHNVAQSIQVDNITHRINQELNSAIEREYPSSRDETHSERFNSDRLVLGEGWINVPCQQSGYVQLVDRPTLIQLAEKYDCCIYMTCHAGTFINHWDGIGRVYQPPKDTGGLIAGIQSAVQIGSMPTAEEDFVYSVRQLSQIAVRALSPGVNDPFTAYSCIDRLINGLGTVVQRPEPPNCFNDKSGHLRLVTSELEFAGLLEAALDEICEHGRANGVFMQHFLGALQHLARACSRDTDKQALFDYLSRLRRDCEIFIKSESDLEEIQKIISHIHQLLRH